jgi:hypothetical protein
VLDRGFCIVKRPDGTLVTFESLRIGDPVSIQFAREAEAGARVETLRPGRTNGSEEKPGR